MAIILITGGNTGLGYETARRLIALDNKVYIGCRDMERGVKKDDPEGEELHLLMLDSHILVGAKMY